MTITEPQPLSRSKPIAYAIGLQSALLTLVFLPVGRLDWSPGWVFIGFLVIAFAALPWFFSVRTRPSTGHAAVSSPALNTGTGYC